MSYKLFPASGARLHDSLTVLQHYPRGNRRAAAVFKSAVEAFGPELGRPTRSVGGCRLTDGTKASLLAVGDTTLVAKAEVALREQGGYRAAIFEVDGYRITAALHDADATRPDTAIIGWTDGDVAAANEYAEVPWDGRNLCE